VNGTKIFCHADASFGIHADGKSQTARVFTLGNGCIVANTTKQKMTTRSSCESELVCGSDSASEVLGLRNYMLTRNHTEHKAILVQDNQSAATIMTNGLASVRKTKHMNLKYFFIKDYVEDGQREVRSIGTNDMIADVLSKPLVRRTVHETEKHPSWFRTSSMGRKCAVKHQSDTTSPKIV
jgi:hypothetical protein